MLFLPFTTPRVKPAGTIPSSVLPFCSLGFDSKSVGGYTFLSLGVALSFDFSHLVGICIGLCCYCCLLGSYYSFGF